MTTFKERMLGLIQQGGSIERQAIDYLYNIRSFKSFSDFKEVIITMLSVDRFQNYYNDRIIVHISEYYQNNSVNRREIEEFMRELLENQINLGEKYSFYTFIYLKYMENPGFVFPVAETTLKKICLNRLKLFVKMGEDDVIKCSNLYYLCRDHTDNNQNVHLQVDARKYMRMFIENFPWSYIKFLIRPYGLPIYTRVNSEFTIEPFVEFTFNGWNGFWEFLNNFLSSDLYPKYRESFDKYYKFFIKFRDSNYKPVPVNSNDYKYFGIDELIKENNWEVVSPFNEFNSDEFL